MTIQPLSTEPVEDTPAIFGLDEMADAEDLSSTGVDGAPSAEAPGTPSATGEGGEAAVEGTQAPPAADSVPAAPPAPALPSQEQYLAQELARERQQRAYLEHQQQQLQMAQEAMAYRQQLENQGIPQDQADYMSRERQSYRLREVELQRQAQSQSEHLQGKMNAALYYAARHPGADPKMLFQYDSPQAMEAAARSATEISSLKKEIAGLKRAQVPAGQTFDNSQPSAAALSDDEEWVNTVYGDPDYVASPADHVRAKKFKETLR